MHFMKRMFLKSVFLKAVEWKEIMVTNNVIRGNITLVREQQNLDAVKSCTLKFLMAFKLKIAEGRIPVGKKKKR